MIFSLEILIQKGRLAKKNKQTIREKGILKYSKIIKKAYREKQNF
jgi:hypothetical protein